MPLTSLQRWLASSMGAVLAIAISGSGFFASPALAQAPATQAPAVSNEPIRALQYYTYKRVAESGPERGRELYYFKCWQCHNEFQTSAPQLTGLYQSGADDGRAAGQRCDPFGQDQERRRRHARVSP